MCNTLSKLCTPDDFVHRKVEGTINQMNSDILYQYRFVLERLIGVEEQFENDQLLTADEICDFSHLSLGNDGQFSPCFLTKHLTWSVPTPQAA